MHTTLTLKHFKHVKPIKDDFRNDLAISLIEETSRANEQQYMSVNGLKLVYLTLFRTLRKLYDGGYPKTSSGFSLGQAREF